MKRLISCIYIMLLIAVCLADPDWEVVVYTNSTVAYCRITIDDIPASESDIIGAFVEGECRGVEDIFLYEGESYAVMNIQGNVPEEVSFLVWDESIDTICPVEYTTMSSPGYDIGYPPDYLPIEAYSGNPVNHYPTMELPESLVVPEDIATSFDFSEYCWDIDGDELSVTGIDSEHLSVSSTELIVTITSALNWVGIEYVTFWLSDGSLSVHDSLEVFVTAVNDPPVINDTYPPAGNIEVEQYEPFSFAVFAEDVDSALEYEWFIDNQQQAASDYIFEHTFNDIDSYSVLCSVSDQEYSVTAEWQVSVYMNPAGSNEIAPFSEIIAYPNPCKNSLSLQWNASSRSGPQTVSLYNTRGQKVSEIILPDGQRSVTLSQIKELPAGVYMLKVSDIQNSRAIKFTVR